MGSQPHSAPGVPLPQQQSLAGAGQRRGSRGWRGCLQSPRSALSSWAFWEMSVFSLPCALWVMIGFCLGSFWDSHWEA